MLNNSFITSHGPLLEDKDRIRVAHQLLTILEDWYKNNDLKTLEVLDYGCSNGVITNYISKYTKKVLGVDVDEVAIKEAKQKYKSPHLSFLLTRDVKIPRKSNSFDLVICNQVYSYLEDPDLMADEIRRVLKEGGICLFTGDNRLRIVEPLYNLPFIRLFPKTPTKLLLKTLGYKNIYVGEYKTYWGIKKLFNKFIIYDYTLTILKNPKQFKYKKLEKYNNLLSIIPTFLLKIIEPFSPSFIFILKK